MVNSAGRFEKVDGPEPARGPWVGHPPGVDYSRSVLIIFFYPVICRTTKVVSAGAGKSRELTRGIDTYRIHRPTHTSIIVSLFSLFFRRVYRAFRDNLSSLAVRKPITVQKVTFTVTLTVRYVFSRLQSKPRNRDAGINDGTRMDRSAVI